MSIVHRELMVGALLIFAPVWMSIPASGQALDAPSSSPVDEGDIVVTAQKRSERLQDVPLAVTALSADTLSQRQINDTNGLVQAVSSLTYTQGNNVSNSTFRVRGIGTTLFNQGSESSVSTVIDGVVLARQAQGFVDLADLERVEVLRGPQGTLFGKNATAGVISVVTARPTRTFTARAEATIAELGEYRIKGTVSGPLSDTLGFRLSGFRNDVGGHITNVASGRDQNGFKSWGLRGKLDWAAAPGLNLLGTIDYRHTDANCCQPQYIKVTTPLLAQLLSPVVASRHNRQVSIDVPSFNNTRQLLGSLEANLDLGRHTLTSLTAWQDFNFDNNVDVDGLNTPSPIFVPFGNGRGILNGGPAGVKQFSQELRLTSPQTGAITYVAGLYFLDLDVTRGFRRRLGNCVAGGVNGAAVFGQPCAAPTYVSTFHNAKSTTQQYAAFGQAELKLVDRLSAIAGARLQRERVGYEGNRPGLPLVTGDAPLMGASRGSGSTRDTDLSGKLGLQYRASRDAQAYVTWTRGYKGAAYDIEVNANFASQRPVLPETVKAWEAGVKLDLFDRALSLNTAAFYADYANLQVQAAYTDPVTGIVSTIPTNAGSAITKGVEVEWIARPARGLTISGGATYLATDLDVDGVSCPLPQQGAAPVQSGFPVNQCYRTAAGRTPLLNVRGGRIPNAPSWRGMLTTRYETDLPNSDLALFGQVSANGQTRVNFSLEQDPELAQGGYATFEASIGVRQVAGRYSATLFVRNIGDRHFLTSVGRAGQLTNAANPGNLTGFLPKDADRYVGATFSIAY
ncbi:iron complex outermembrane receptor protein [Sphingomonas sp. SORGH_AS 950]|uniref:TonB-dependent receptor n=1 Tax=Sphingomonas sp. SORGH_AS_0950 TaxID=3041792 RepID=UPI002780FDD1|nr:TonB-dependent receptor [Sphingomonas sp. SORGH_AS_0950]MDQ1158994.1 iron complex outermembrane receptor protein [Sphingomonas sp. SORGH_AS_0950]